MNNNRKVLESNLTKFSRHIAFMGLIILFVGLCAIPVDAKSSQKTVGDKGIFLDSNLFHVIKSNYTVDFPINSNNLSFVFLYNNSQITISPVSLDTPKTKKNIKNNILAIKKGNNKLSYGSLFGDNTDYELDTEGAIIKESLKLFVNPLNGEDINSNLSLRHKFTYTNLKMYVNNDLWDGITKITTPSDIIFKDINNTPVYSFIAPFVFDFTGNRLNLTYTIYKKSGELIIELNIPNTYLDSATYPVTIDPSIYQLNHADESPVYLESGEWATQSFKIPSSTNVTVYEYIQIYTGCASSCTGIITISSPTRGIVKSNYYYLSGSTDWQVIDTTPVQLYTNEVYNVTLTPSTGSLIWYLQSGNLYSNGQAYYYDGSVLHNYSNYDWTFSLTYDEITPIYPLNGSTISKSVSPTLYDVDFDWDDLYIVSGGGSTNIVVSSDSAFSSIVGSYTGTDGHKIFSLSAGTYYWKFRAYYPSYGYTSDYSRIESFVLQNTATGGEEAGTGNITGIVYEYINNVQIPIESAFVYAQSSTWSGVSITGTDGRYTFSNKVNGTIYTLYATKTKYQTSALAIVNVSGYSYRDIPLIKTDPTVFEPEQLYVTIHSSYAACATISCDIVGANIKIYAGGDTIPLYNSTTDYMGNHRAYLYKTILYKVVLTNVSAGLDFTTYFYPVDSIKEIIVGTTTWIQPNSSTYNTSTPVNVTYTNVSSSLQNFTSNYVNSSIGLGRVGQGIVVSMINLLCVNSGGLVTTILVSGVLIYLGLISMTTVAFFIMTGLALFILTRT